MSIVIRAHFDGKGIVPDEPLDLPIGPLEAELQPGDSRLPQEEIERRLGRRSIGWPREPGTG